MAYKEPEPIKDEQALEKANADLEQKDRKSRQEAAVALRIAGATYSDIARTLDYASPALARQAVERSLASTAGDESRDQLRFIEARRLERLLRGLWKKATDEDNEEHLSAVRTAIAVIDRHAKLYGLDAPQEMVVYTPAASELEEWVSKMAKQVRGEFPEEADIVTAEYEIVDDGKGDDE